MGIGTVEGHGWQWTNAVVACSDMTRHLHSGRRERQDESPTPNPISNFTGSNPKVTFCNIGRRSWYVIHNQLRSWKGGQERGNTGTDKVLRQAFIAGLETLILESTPPPLTRIREGGEETAIKNSDMARIEQMPREQQDGHAEYKSLMKIDFDKLSRRRQVLKLKN